jgi:hypothetical protein
MSQAGISGKNSIGNLAQVTTDNGVAIPVAGNLNLFADDPAGQRGTGTFSATGNTIELNMQDTNRNVGIGINSIGGNIINSIDNVCVGNECGRQLTTGDDNVAVGSFCFDTATTANGCVALGRTALALLVNGNNNIAIGSAAGLAYTTNESNNICIGRLVNGTIGESNTLRIGVSTGTGDGQISRTFIQGIAQVATVNSQTVSINTVTGQLGSYPSGGFIAYNAIDSASSPYDAIATDVYISADASGGPITINLPDSPSIARVFVIKDQQGKAASNNITVTTVGGAVLIDGNTTFVLSANSYLV